jgi:hypothetical protein
MAATSKPILVLPDGSYYSGPIEYTAIVDVVPIKRRRKSPGRPPKPFWTKLRPAVFRYLKEHGCGEHGDLAKLEAFMAKWIRNKSYSASETTIREHANTFTEEFKKEKEGRR